MVGRLMPQGSDRRLVACLSHVVQIAGSLALLCAAGTDVVLLVAGVLLFGAATMAMAALAIRTTKRETSATISAAA
jgi:hypothetical protein